MVPTGAFCFLYPTVACSLDPELLARVELFLSQLDVSSALPPCIRDTGVCE